MNSHQRRVNQRKKDRRTAPNRSAEIIPFPSPRTAEVIPFPVPRTGFIELDVSEMMDDIFGVHIHFILTDDHTVVPVNYQEYIDWQMKRGNLGPVRVGFANIKDGVDVSTVFLGLNHQHDPDGSPLVFETMVMGGVRDGWMDRYSTWAQAAKGHAKTVMQVRQEEFKESGK